MVPIDIIIEPIFFLWNIIHTPYYTRVRPKCDESILGRGNGQSAGKKIRLPISMGIGTTNAPRCWVPVLMDHTIGPKIMENGDIYFTAPRRKTWEGVPVAIWCSEWICRMRGGLVHHTIMIPAALSLPLLRGACSMSFTDNISKWLVLYQNLQFFPVSNFFDCWNMFLNFYQLCGGIYICIYIYIYIYI